MRDILPDDQPYYERVYAVADSVAKFYGFSPVTTPVVEFSELFEKGTGSSTDIVEKQMYTFKSKGGDSLALRPEFTPSIARSYIQHGMVNQPQPVKLFTMGPLFRHESPQAGRYRQFHQFDLEAIGDASPAIDAELIQVFYSILRDLGFRHLICEVNSIGDSKCRPYYKKLLSSFFRSRQHALCADCRRRVKVNPLRVLDCKEEKCQRVRAQAPQFVDHLCDECKKHFRSVLEFLDEADIPYHLDPYLVRGLDYYTKTVFEIYSDQHGTDALRQSAIVGGGRYDALLKLLGGKDTPAAGGAGGVERIVEVMKAGQFSLPKEKSPKVYLAQLGDLSKKKTLKLLEEFRASGILVAESLGRDSLKVQLARADKLGVEYTLILGQKEALENSIVLRKMDTGKQEVLKMEKVVAEIKKRVKR